MMLMMMEFLMFLMRMVEMMMITHKVKNDSKDDGHWNQSSVP